MPGDARTTYAQSVALFRPGWQRALGRFTGDEIMLAIDQAALAYREEDRRKFKDEYDAAEGDAQ